MARGPLEQSFPWTPLSATGVRPADLWWGLHLFAAPFTAIGDPVVGLRISMAVWTAFCLALLFVSVRRMSVQFAWCVPFIWLFSGALETGRLIALRPQNASAALLVALVALVTRPGPAWMLVTVGWAVAFLHQTVSWIVVPVAVVAGASACWSEKSAKPLIRIGWAVGGVGLGWVVRPAALRAAALMQIQIGELSKARAQGLDLPFGTEVSKLTTAQFIHFFPAFAVVWLALVGMGALAAYKSREHPDRCLPAAFAACAVLSLGFYELMLTASTRGLKYWTVFAAVTMSLSGVLCVRSRGTDMKFSWALAGALPVLTWATSWGAFSDFMSRGAIYPNRMQAPMEFLAANSMKGDLVWNAHWEFFGEMLFWDRKNVYVQGMDPIFLYSQNRELCEIVDACRADRWGDPSYPVLLPLVAGFAVSRDLYTALSERFDARWALVLPSATPILASQMGGDLRFTKMYDDGVVDIFKMGPTHLKAQVPGSLLIIPADG